MNLPDQLQSALGSMYAFERERGRGGTAAVHLTQDLRLADSPRPLQGANAGDAALAHTLTLLMEAVPQVREAWQQLPAGSARR